MHRHRMVAQILLIIPIINSGLAAPAVSVREIQEARRALAVPVPAEGVVAVLQKRNPEQPNPQILNPNRRDHLYHLNRRKSIMTRHQNR
jgi:hypothetical protein